MLRNALKLFGHKVVLAELAIGMIAIGKGGRKRAWMMITPLSLEPSNRRCGMKKFTLQPDPHMRWIYDYNHPRYRSPEAKDLRERRSRAIQSAPEWMIELAMWNDEMKGVK